MNKQIDITDVVLTTERLTLRPFRESDLNDFYEYASVDGVGQMAGWNPHRNPEESRTILSHFIEGNHVFALEHKGKVIGSLGIEKYREENYPELDDLQGREIGYVLSKAYWGQGLMPEAVKAVIAWLFSREKLDFILIGHFDHNMQSKRVIEKCGFKYIKSATFETRFGTVENTLEYILYADEYAEFCKSSEEPKHFMQGYIPNNDTDLVQEIYRRFDEDTRLNKSQAARVEFLTTVRYIEKYLTPGAKILDIGAGTGEYSLYFGRKGYHVSALELADANMEVFQAKLTKDDPIELVQGNALDLSRYADDTFDIVLLFGPLYHLHEEADKLRCIEEAKRVCKPEGKIFFAFISNDIVILTMQQAHPEYMLEGDYNKETFRLDDFPFVFHTLDHCRTLLRTADIETDHEIASDGVSELLQELINSMDKASYEQYLKYHFYICEKPECLGMSNHLLFVGHSKSRCTPRVSRPQPERCNFRSFHASSAKPISICFYLC